MNFLLKTIPSLILLSIILFACKNNSKVGLEVAPQGQHIGAYMQDTFDVALSTILLDSVNTSNPGNIWVGDYNDPNIGKLSAKTFSQLSISSPGLALPFGAVFDSLTFVFKYGDLKVGDTTKPFNLNIYQLNAVMDTNTTYYSNSTIPYNPIAIGGTSFSPSRFVNRKVDSIYIRLSDALGQELLDNVGTDNFSTPHKFKEYFKGLMFASDGSNSAIIGGVLTGTVLNRMVLCYHKADSPNVPLKFEYPIDVSTKKFVNYTNDRSGTSFSSITKPSDSLSSKSSSLAAIQSGVGLAVKVSIPKMKRFKEQLGNVAVHKAELIIQSPGVINHTSNQPPYLVMLQASAASKYLFNASGLPLPVQLDGQSITGTTNTQFVSYDFTNNHYSILLTDYVQALLFDKVTPYYILQASVPNPSRIVIGDRSHPTSPMKLKVYYTKIQ